MHDHSQIAPLRRAITALPIAFVLESGLSATASNLDEESLSGPQAPAQAIVTLEKWEYERDLAREAFKPVLQALKLIADEEFRQKVINHEGDNFQAYQKEKVSMAWARKKIVVQFLKDLYGAHTTLIKDHATVLDSLKTITLALEKERGVNSELKQLLKEKTTAIENLEALLREAQQETTQTMDLARKPDEVVIDVEGQKYDINSPLLGEEEDHNANASYTKYTKLFYTSAGAVFGAGMTALGIYLYFKYRA